MEKRIFKTNIKCDGCIQKVSSTLNELVGIGNWTVNLALPTKPLTINNEAVSADNLEVALSKVGYTAVSL